MNLVITAVGCFWSVWAVVLLVQKEKFAVEMMEMGDWNFTEEKSKEIGELC